MIEHAIPADALQPNRVDLYYRCDYWNEIPAVKAIINRRITGNPEQTHVEFFHELVGGRRFARGLFLACGNGRVEREFLSRGIIERGVGIDVSREMLEAAREASQSLPLTYHLMDMNQAVLPEERYDLIVNVAAGHHIGFVDRVFRAYASGLNSDGYFVNYDYVGPHRFQYPWQQWEACWRLNESLPENARQKLAYPHFPTMIHVDPTEAIHSELLIDTFQRYFTLDAYRPSGGALAYPLLTFNEALGKLPPEEQAPVVETIMRADEEYLLAHPESTLFAFWYGRAKRGVLNDTVMLASWEAQENAREAAAAANGYRYYERPLIEALMYAPDGTGALHP